MKLDFVGSLENAAVVISRLHRGEKRLADVRQGNVESLRPNVDPDALEGLKFSACLPPGLGRDVLARRALDKAGVARVLNALVRMVTCGARK